MSTPDQFPPPSSPTDSAASPLTDDVSATDGSSEGAVATATETARHVASGAKDEARSVVHQARGQVSSLTDQTRDELRRQAEERGTQAAGQLRSFSDQLSALTDGRPDEAGQLTKYLEDGRERVSALASRLEEEGPQAVLDDVARFGRRRPALFLLGAAVAGVAVGRLIRAGASGDDGESDADFSAVRFNDPASSPVGVATGSLETDVYATEARAGGSDPFEDPPAVAR